MSEVEKTGVVPVICKRVELSLTKDENKKSMCTYYYVSRPGQILEKQTASSILDGTYRNSSAICSRENKLIMVFGIDRSDTDLTCSQRLCNRKDGNSSLHVQPIACVEKCSEKYENESKTIFNPNYPTGTYLQSMVNDDCQMMVVSLGKSDTFEGAPSYCTCALFRPTPTQEPCYSRNFDVQYLPEPVDEKFVTYAQQDIEELGLPPKIPIPVNEKEISVKLVHSSTDKNHYQRISNSPLRQPNDSTIL